jgi:hypothetical protein
LWTSIDLKFTAAKPFNIFWIENFSPQKRTFSTLKHENSILFSIFVGHFALLDPDPATQINADPDPQP